MLEPWPIAHGTSPAVTEGNNDNSAGEFAVIALLPCKDLSPQAALFSWDPRSSHGREVVLGCRKRGGLLQPGVTEQHPNRVSEPHILVPAFAELPSRVSSVPAQSCTAIACPHCQCCC